MDGDWLCPSSSSSSLQTKGLSDKEEQPEGRTLRGEVQSFSHRQTDRLTINVQEPLCLDGWIGQECVIRPAGQQFFVIVNGGHEGHGGCGQVFCLSWHVLDDVSEPPVTLPPGDDGRWPGTRGLAGDFYLFADEKRPAERCDPDIRGSDCGWEWETKINKMKSEHCK